MKRRVRLWPAIVILLGAGAALTWTYTAGDATGQERTVRAMPVVFFTVLLLVLWFLLLSRLPGRVRLAAFGLLVLAGIALGLTVRIRGVTGDLVPVLGWRWDSDANLPRNPTAAAPIRGGTADGVPAYSQFLGPGRDAVVPGVAIATDWEARPPREVWRREVGGGWSAFAVAAGLAVTQEQRGADELVSAYDLRTGEPRWTHADPVRYETTIGGVGPRATPTIAEGRVYTLGATGILNALELDTGRRLWSVDVIADNGASVPEWGKSCSPLVTGELVVVSAGGAAGRSLVAYDRESGERVWGGGGDASGYGSPLLAELAGVPQILIFNEGSVAAHDPATGEVLWSHPWPATQPNVAQPLPLGDDRLLVSSGYGIGSKLFEIAPDAGGGLEPRLVWESPRLKAKFTNVVAHAGSVYGLDDGTLVCLDPATGERRWKRGRYGHGQVLLAGGLLLVLTEDGDVVLVRPDPERHVELARLRALAGKVWNNPALAGPYLLVRNDREAACYELPLEGGG